MAQRIIKDDIRDNSREYRIYNKFGEYSVLLKMTSIINLDSKTSLIIDIGLYNSRLYSLLLQITSEIIRIYNKFGEYRVLLLDNVLYNSKHYNVLLYNVRDNSRQYSVLLQITPEIILDSTTYYYRHDV